MAVTGLDHVNIVARDLDASAAFYAEVLGLERRDGPPSRSPDELQWMYDPAGRPIVHLAAAGARPGPAAEPGAQSGAVDHVAFACHGHAAMIERLASRAIPCRTMEIAELGLRQIFLVDPDGVKLELNFRE